MVSGVAGGLALGGVGGLPGLKTRSALYPDLMRACL